MRTERIYTEKNTGKKFRLYSDLTTGSNSLVNEKTGETVNAFYVSAHTAVDLKYQDGKVEHLEPGEFIRTDTNKPTHSKFFIQSRFKKI